MVIFSVVGISELNLVILAGDLALFLTIPVFAQEIKKVMRKNASKALLKQESPLNWVKTCAKFAVFSLLASLAYGIVNGRLILNQQQNVDFLFYFGIIFFLIGLLQAVRLIWFIVDPTSTSNIFAGKFLLTTSKYGLRAITVSFIGVLLISNGFMLYQIYSIVFEQNLPLTIFGLIYLFTLILSFVTVIPTTYSVVFHLEDKVSPWYLVAVIAFISPWVLLIMSSLL